MYSYDAGDNRVNVVRGNGTTTSLPGPLLAAYDTANQQIQFNSSTPNATYDGNGNLSGQTDVNGTTTYTWDARNRLIAISGPGINASFAYDAIGRRVSKTINGVTTQYLYDGHDIVAELSGGAVVATYLRSLEIDEPFARYGTTTEFYHIDALNSVLALTDNSGTVSTTYAYDPFGNTAVNGVTSSNPFQFTGRENDGTGLYYYRARYYSPKLHRFLSEDPIGLAGGQVNFYAYARNNPTTFTDSTGQIVDTIADVAFISYDFYRLATDGRKGLGENLIALGLDIGGVFIPGVTGLGPASRGAKPLLGKNPRPRPGAGRIDTDLPGGRPTAKSIFKKLSEGQPIIQDRMTNGGIRRHTPDNSVQIRMNQDGTTRLDLTGRGSLGTETIHFNK